MLSNTFGTAPLPIGAAHVALRGKSATVPMSDRALTFSGAGSTIIPPGAVMISDPVDLTVPPPRTRLHREPRADNRYRPVGSLPSAGAPVPDDPMNSFCPFCRVKSRPLPFSEPSFAR